MKDEIEKFLKNYPCSKGETHTHTKIGNRELGVYGGSYLIPQDKIDSFYDIYKKVCVKNKIECYFTEKQFEQGSLLIDVDFRYDTSITERQHTKKHIIILVEQIVKSIQKIKSTNKEVIEIYVMEKDNIHMDESITKDGIHIIVNTEMDKKCKILLRNNIILNIKTLWEDLPIINNWDDVFDNSVIMGYSNWQLYGSRKPGYEAYELVYLFECTFKGNNESIINEKSFNHDWILMNFTKLTARNKNLVKLSLNQTIKKEYDALNENMKPKIKPNVNVLENSIFRTKNIHNITNRQELKEYVKGFLEEYESNNEHTIKEVYQYTMSLTEEYWSSFDKWIRVGWALKNKSSNLFPIWIEFSSKWDLFDFDDLPKLNEQWMTFGNSSERLTVSSIIFWARECNYAEYTRISKESISYFIHYACIHQTDYDIAYVLYQMNKENFKCVNIKNNTWFEFKNNHWEQIDEGFSLRSKISTELFNAFKNELTKKQKEQENPQLENVSKLKDKDSPISIANNCKSRSKKGQIMKEASDIFYDIDFYKHLDSNPLLLGCKNYVIDFKEKNHRIGKFDDYISLSTNIDYHPLDYYEKTSPLIIVEIKDFMSQLFPNENIRNYMWDHLSSTLLGTNLNHSFNLYIGTGKNGKSKLVDLMSKVLGDYKGTVPITLVTQKRTGIGSTSSEVAQLIGKRYAVMQEPSKGDIINEGIMKEITGGDPIQARALFKESITFIPQFKLAVCTNTLFDIKSNDDGTWRRIRVVNFESKFMDEPYKDPKYPEEQYKYQYKIDKNIDIKFETWAPVMLSMLVDIAYKKNGMVEDCPEVLASSEEYRKSQDIYLDFITSCIIKHDTPQPNKLKITSINDCFKNWYNLNHGGYLKMSNKELKDNLIKRYGNYPPGGWSNLSLQEEFMD